MAQYVPYSRNSPFVFYGQNGKLLLSGGVEFKDGVCVIPYVGSPVGVLTLPKGSLVLDSVNAKAWMSLDGAGAYSDIGSGGGGAATVFNATHFSGAGTALDPVKSTGIFYPAVDGVAAWQVRKADNVTAVATIDTTNVKFFLDGKVTMGELDAFGRTLIRNYGVNAAIKLGGIQQDGDPADVSAEGIISIGPNSSGAFDLNNWAFARIKSTRVGINNCIANVQNYIFRADEVGLYLRNDAGSKTFDVDRATGTITLSGGIIRPLGNSATAIQFMKADGATPMLVLDTATDKVITDRSVIVKGTDILPAIQQKQTAFKSDIVYPAAGTYAGTVRTATDQATLVAAIAASVAGDSISVTADITLTATLAVNKAIKIDGDIPTRVIQTAGGGADPVTMISVTASNVTFGSNLTIWHKKTTNTSVDVAISVNATGFVSSCTVKFMEFGYILRGSFAISGTTNYTGAASNNHRHIAIYAISAPSLIYRVTFTYPQENPARASCIYVSSSGAADKFDANLRVKECKQYDYSSGRFCRQFYMQDALVSTSAGVNPSLIFEGNCFNSLNGGIGFYSSTSQPLNFFAYIAVINNYEGNAAVANYKGIMYFDGTTALFPMGTTKIFFGGNRHPVGISAVGYANAYDAGGIGYNTVVYSNNPVIQDMIQPPDGTTYDYAVGNIYSPETTATLGTLIAGATAEPLILDGDMFGFADLSAANVLKKATGADVKAYLKTYFDTLYSPVGGDMLFANTSLGAIQSVAPATDFTFVNYTVPVGKTLKLLSGTAESDGDAKWTLYVDGVAKARARSAHQDRNVALFAPLELTAGQVLQVVGRNVTIQGQTNEISAWIHAREV
jgi:hypothetical protein